MTPEERLLWEISAAPVLWTCLRCETDHRHGSPEGGCPDCGFRVEVAS